MCSQTRGYDVESVRHVRARTGRVETSSFPGSFLFLPREVVCRSFRSFSIPSRNLGHLNFWRLVWSTSEQTLRLNAPPNLFFVRDKISDRQKPITSCATVTFYALTNLKNLDLVDLFFLAYPSRKWIFTPPYLWIDHLHSAGKTWHFWFK